MEGRQQQQRQHGSSRGRQAEKRAVGALLLASTTSIPFTIFPNTGCAEGVCGLNQSRKSLCTVLMKNCEPPLFGWPVLACAHSTTSARRGKGGCVCCL